MAYAETTSVAFERSIAEIVTLLKRAGAERIAQVDDTDHFAIQFSLADRMLRFRIGYPALDDMPTHDGNRRAIDKPRRLAKLDQAKRQRGRALLLVIKAKLESVESGVETIEQAFLAQVVMADGATVYDRIAAPIAAEYATGAPSVLLLGGPA